MISKDGDWVETAGVFPDEPVQVWANCGAVSASFWEADLGALGEKL